MLCDIKSAVKSGKEKWSGKMRSRKKSMEMPKTGGARKSAGKVLVTK